MDMYEKTYREFFALPGYVGKKSESEKFAGGDMTLTYESLMPEGKALQSCTSHDLGQNFAKVFDIKFQNTAGATEYVWQTSWGLSTRSIGGLIMAHGDDNGLRLPPRLAPIQVVVIPVKTDASVLDACRAIASDLKKVGVRVFVDESDNESMGSKINTWELKGVPVRLEVGPKELEKGSVTAVRRDTGEKKAYDANGLVKLIPELLEEIQNNLYREAEKFLKENTHRVDSYDEFKKVLIEKHGFLAALWCEDAGCEQKIKEETKATARCLPIDAKDEDGVCIYCGKPATHRWLFAQAY
jgi:prolyl-tRNA synthetase